MHRKSTNKHFAEGSTLRIHPQFLRSIHLERDYADPQSSQGYILTDFGRSALQRLCASLGASSTQRAWRITGDYGSGKSNFALALARVASKQKETLPRALHEFIPAQGLEPVLVTGDRESIAHGLLRGLKQTCSRLPKNVTLARAIDQMLQDPAPRGASVLQAIEQLRDYVCSSGGRSGHLENTSGVIIILDELGKFFEFAALHPSRDDIYLLQQLAELASRSGEKPIVVVGLLHQGIAAYSDGMDTAARREWNKIAGRFEEIVFTQPLEQLATLVAATLNVDSERLASKIVKGARIAMKEAVRNNWYGPSAAMATLTELAPALYPIDPFVLPVLVRFFRRFSQNERSLFSFLSSNEPYGLLVHFAEASTSGDPYRLAHLFDYVRANLAHVLDTSSSRAHWAAIDETISSAADCSATDLEILKSVGILNLIDASDLPPTKQILAAAIGGADPKSTSVLEAIEALSKKKRLLYERGSIRGLCLWPNTSVDLDGAFQRGLQAVADHEADAAKSLARHIGRSYLVPRRHYIETGTLRAFEVLPISSDDLESLLDSPPLPDGRRTDGHIVVCLTNSESQRTKVIAAIGKKKLSRSILLVVPGVISGIAPVLNDLKAWEWVAANEGELAHDRRAREEVQRQRAFAQQRLERRAGPLLDLRNAIKEADMDWFHCGKKISLEPGRKLMEFLSEQCQRIYPESPRVRNELINRTSPSAAAVTARTKITEQIAIAAHLPFLGMPAAKTPPEMAIYRSILLKGNLHVETDTGWKLQIPPVDQDILNLRPAFTHIQSLLEAAGDDLIPIQRVFESLRKPPLGIRDGLSPLILALFIAIEQHRVAVYEDGTYIHKMGGFEFMRLLKEPEFFEIQSCAIEGVRAEVFAKLASSLDIVNDKPNPQLLDVVRPLCVFAASIPDYARNTKLLSARTLAVRSALMAAREPSVLLFRALPEACGIQSFGSSTSQQEHINGFASALQHSIHELREAYPGLLRRMSESVRQNFHSTQSLSSFRKTIGDRVVQLMNVVSDPGLRTFMLRLNDQHLNDIAWLESLGSTLVRKAPERWEDADEVEFHHKLSIHSNRFARTEAAAIDAAPKYLNGHACRLALTRTNGAEVYRLIHWEAEDDEKLAALEEEISKLLHRSPLGLAAATRALWASLENLK
jgi:hypothetical protein